MKSLSCNTSGVLVPKNDFKCRIKPVSRFLQRVEVNFEVLRKMKQIYVSTNFFVKFQIIKIELKDRHGVVSQIWSVLETTPTFEKN